MLAGVAPLDAQRFGDLRAWDVDQWQHVAAGAAVALVVRGPWIAKPWRDTVWKRGAWQLGLSLVYERVTHVTAKGYGSGLDGFDTGLDVLANMVGWLLVELLDLAF